MSIFGSSKLKKKDIIEIYSNDPKKILSNKNLEIFEYDNRSYQKSFYKTSHNSYQRDRSIPYQLDNGARGLELDINDDDYEDLNYLQIGHWFTNDLLNGNHYGDGNPDDDKFENWLKVIVKWSEENRNHTPITLFIELKSWHWKNLEGVIDSVIKNSIPSNILFPFIELGKYFPNDFTPWPLKNRLKGKIIVVLTSFWGWFHAGKEGWTTRWNYYNNDNCNAAFVAWTEDDEINMGSTDRRPLTLKNESRFYMCNKTLGNLYFHQEAQKLIRSDYDGTDIFGYDPPATMDDPVPQHIPPKGYSNGFRINFPIADYWNDDPYNNLYPFDIN